MKNNSTPHSGEKLPHTFFYYALILLDIDGVSLPQDTISRHVSHLRELDNSGKLVLAGPFTDHPSSLIVLNVQSADEASAIAKADPLVSEGIRTFEVRSWRIANKANNYLLQ